MQKYLFQYRDLQLLCDGLVDDVFFECFLTLVGIFPALGASAENLQLAWFPYANIERMAPKAPFDLVSV